MAEHFLIRESEDHRFSPDALRMLQAYSWPGNVRELQNVVNRLWVAAAGPEIGSPAVREELARAVPNDAVQVENAESTIQLDSLEAKAIENALEKTRGHRGQAAAELGISRRTLSRKLQARRLSSARNAAPVALGAIRDELQHSFRADLGIPVTLRTAEGHELACTAVNLSAGGIGVEELNAALSYGCVLRARFLVPGSKTPVDALAHLVWGGMHGRAGLAFTEVEASARAEMRRWLFQKMAEEGWTGPPEPSESATLPDEDFSPTRT
jgi:DNA-binding protein Fis